MLTVRNAAFGWEMYGAVKALPFVPLASSTLVLLILARDAGGGTFGPASTPAGWTLVDTAYNANDAYGLFTAPGTVGGVPASGTLGGPRQPFVFLELPGVDAAKVTTGRTLGQGWGPPTTAGPAAPHPSALGGEVMALALLMGTTGDPSPGCYWANKADWTKEECATQAHDGYHPWWAVYSRRYAVAPAAVSDTFANTIGQSTMGLVALFPPVAGAPGVMPRFW